MFNIFCNTSLDNATNAASLANKNSHNDKYTKLESQLKTDLNSIWTEHEQNEHVLQLIYDE